MNLNYQYSYPQGGELSPLLFSLYTNDCTSMEPSVKTTLPSSASSVTVRSLLTDTWLNRWVLWSSHNNLELNMLKTVEKLIDFRRSAAGSSSAPSLREPSERLFSLPQEQMEQFYTAATESVITTSITVRCSSATTRHSQTELIIGSAEKTLGVKLTPLYC